jgi:CRP-like cAMP-binding protein
MDLPVRLGIYAARGLIDAVYFPEAGMISLVANMNDGMQAEVGVIGREGMLGTSLISGTDTSFVEAFVQMPGSALRMSAADFRAELDVNGPFRHHVLQYQEALHIQIMQTAACNVCHGLEQRLARWLLMAHDRIGGTDVPLTQELLAMMLGVHRPSVTVIARVLQRAGLVRYASGQITILDRPGLENTSCECYAMVRQRFDMLLGANTFSTM